MISSLEKASTSSSFPPLSTEQSRGQPMTNLGPGRRSSRLQTLQAASVSRGVSTIRPSPVERDPREGPVGVDPVDVVVIEDAVFEDRLDVDGGPVGHEEAKPRSGL